jgi:hypothetical protein
LAIFKGREATPDELAEKLGMPLENCWLATHTLGLLRARLDGPRNCRAAENPDDLAPPHVEHGLPPAWERPPDGDVSVRSVSGQSACHGAAGKSLGQTWIVLKCDWPLPDPYVIPRPE